MAEPTQTGAVGRWLRGLFRPAAPAARVAPHVPVANGRGARQYAAANYTRLTSDWLAQSTSGDAELYTSLRTLRNRSRQLVRDNEYAKNSMRIIRNNVIGRGVRFQAQVMMRSGKKPDEPVNRRIDDLWDQWCRPASCHTGGTLSFTEMQRTLIGAIAESGEVLVRKIKGKTFGRSSVPFALELIESDQLVETYTGRGENGNQIRMGVEVDQWHRPVAYWLYKQHPGDLAFTASGLQSNRYERVPADEIFHLYIPERIGMTRGVPWLTAALKRIRDVGGYTEAEIVAARSDASVVGMIESQELGDPGDDADGTGQDGLVDDQEVFDLEAGTIKRLAPGEKFNPWHPTRPNAAMDPFIRVMLRGIASAIGVSYESLSRDYSQSNYSSTRIALLEDRDLWRVLQDWFIEHFLQGVYEDWLEMAVLSGALNVPDFELGRERYCNVRWKPRGWEWIDPAKEVQAAKDSVRCGFTTVTDVLADKGRDIEDLLTTRSRELERMEDLELVFDTDPEQVNDKGIVQPSTPPEEGAPPTPGAAAEAATDSKPPAQTREAEDDKPA